MLWPCPITRNCDSSSKKHFFRYIFYLATMTSFRARDPFYVILLLVDPKQPGLHFLKFRLNVMKFEYLLVLSNFNSHKLPNFIPLTRHIKMRANFAICFLAHILKYNPHGTGNHLYFFPRKDDAQFYHILFLNKFIFLCFVYFLTLWRCVSDHHFSCFCWLKQCPYLFESGSDWPVV